MTIEKRTADLALRQKVAAKLLAKRDNYSGTDGQFAKSMGMTNTAFSTIKNGGLEGSAIREEKWFDLASELLAVNEWLTVRTEVLTFIENDVRFCKETASALMLIDDQGIGKTAAAKYWGLHLANCFYLDCTQLTDRRHFARELAKTVGADGHGTHAQVKAAIKRQLQKLVKPIIILDEAGELDPQTFREIKEYYNAVENRCGWYLMGADSFRVKMEKGIVRKTPAYREIFSRFNGRFRRITPTNPAENQQFYRQMLTDIGAANLPDQPALVHRFVAKCIKNHAQGETGDIRSLATLIKMNRYDDRNQPAAE